MLAVIFFSKFHASRNAHKSNTMYAGPQELSTCKLEGEAFSTPRMRRVAYLELGVRP